MAESAHAPETPLLLIASSDDALKQTLHQWLRKEGYRIAEVSDGDLCIAAIRKYQPDLLLLDVALPPTNGYLLAARLSRLAAPLKIIMLGPHDDIVVERAFKTGAVDYLAIPPLRRLVLERVRALLQTPTAPRRNIDDDSIWYRSLFKAHHEVKIVIDPETMRVVDANQAAVNFYGLSLPQLRAMRAPDIGVMTEDQICEVLLQEAEADEVAPLRSRHRLASGEYREVEIYPSLVDSEGHKLLYVIIHDVTDKVRAEQALLENEAKYRQLFENAGEGIFFVDMETGKIIDVNQYGAQMLGYTVEEILQLHYPEIELPLHADEYAGSQETLPNLSAETYFRRKDGSTLPVETNTRVITQNKRVIGLVFVRDISRRKQMEQSMRQQAEFRLALIDTAKIISSTLNVKEVISLILEQVSRVVPHKAANIMLIDGDEAHVAGYRNYRDEHIGSIKVNIDQVPGLRQMYDTHRPLIIPDTYTSSIWWQHDHNVWIRSYAGAPIIAKGEVIGFMNLDSDVVDMYSDEDGERLMAFANQVALALENARQASRLEKIIEERTRELMAANARLKKEVKERAAAEEAEREQRELAEALRKAAAALASTLNLDELLQRILEQLAVVLPSDSADIMLIENGEAAIKARSGYIPEGMSNEDLLAVRLTVDETRNLRWMKEHKKPLVIADVRDYEGWVFTAKATWIRSHVAAPLIIKDEVIGFLSLTSRQADVYHEQHAERLQAFANQAALALHNARQAASLERRIEERTAALRASEEKYRTLTNQLPLGVYRTTSDNRIIHANPALARMLGAKSIDDLLHVDVTTFFEDPSEHKRLRQTLQELHPASGSHIYQAELQLKTLDGRLIWVRDTSNVIFDDDGNILYVDGTLEDITEQRQAATALQASRQALQLQAESLRTINKIADAIHQSLELETVIRRALEIVIPYSEAVAGAILLLDEAKTTLHVMDYLGLDEQIVAVGKAIPVKDSLSGEAVRRVDIISCDDLSADPLVYEPLRAELLQREMYSAVIIPILGMNTVLGTINLLYKTVHQVSERERETFMSIAKTIGLAITNAHQMANVRAEMWERKRAEEAERRRRLELEVLRQAALAMNESAELETMLYRIAEYAVKMVGADAAHVFICDEGALHFGAGVWEGRRLEAAFSQPREDGITQRVARSGQRIVVDDMAAHPLFEGTNWTGAILSLPLLSKQQVHGVLNVSYRTPHHFTDDEVRALELLADQAVSSLVNFLYLNEIEHEIQERTRAEEDVRRRNAELEMLRQASLNMTSTVDIDRLSTYIVHYALELVGGHYARFFLPDETDRYAVKATCWAQPADQQADITESDAIIEAVLASQELVIVPDAQAPQALMPAWGGGAVALPLKQGEETLGVLQIHWRGSCEIERTQLQVLGLFVDQAAIALNNVRQMERIKREMKERAAAEAAERDQRSLAEALHHAAEVLNSKLELDELLNEILNLLNEVVPYDGASVMLIDQSGRRASVVLSRGFEDEVAQQSIAVYEEDLETSPHYRQILETGRPIVAENVQDLAHWRTLKGMEWIRSHICVPIISEDDPIGFINLDSREVGRFTQEDAKRLLAFANQAAIAIKNAHLVKKLRNYNKQLEQRVNDRTRELNIARARLQAMIASIRDGVMHVSPSGEIMYMNPALEQLTGYAEAEWVQQKLELFALLVPDDNHSERMLARIPRLCQLALKEKGFWRGEFTLKRSDGALIPVELISTLVRSIRGENEGVVTVVRDISEARELARQRRQFVTTASHELRTPVTNMKTRLFLLRRQPERLEEHLEVMELVVERMQNLISHLFDITRFEQGLIQLHFEPTNLSHFLRHVARMQAAEIEIHQLDLQLDIQAEDVVVDIDAERFEQVLTNLLDNAANHTPPGGTVTLRLKTEGQTAALIEVEDTGEGIAEALLPHIFQPFFRGAERKNQGAGLGLAIVKDIVEKHGGAVHVRSTVGQGACFTIRLPLSDSDATSDHLPADEEDCTHDV